MTTATVRGFAVTPVGLQVRAFPRGAVQPVFGLNVGAVWYESPVPDPDEKQLNFMGEIALGAEIRAGRSNRLVVGIRHNHTSNAGTGPVNPGLDSRVTYVGLTRLLGRPPQP